MRVHDAFACVFLKQLANALSVSAVERSRNVSRSSQIVGQWAEFCSTDHKRREVGSSKRHQRTGGATAGIPEGNNYQGLTICFPFNPRTHIALSLKYMMTIIARWCIIYHKVNDDFELFI